MRDVARAAGVSASTVSRILSGRGDFPDATRARVKAVADELGYDVSRYGRSRPAEVGPQLVELVLASFDTAWSLAAVTGARGAASARGLDLVLTQERDDADDDWPARAARRHPSGVILGQITPTGRQLDVLAAADVPVVLLDPRSRPIRPVRAVVADDRAGGYEAGAHLAASGLRSFAILAGTPHYRFGRAREEGFRAAVTERVPDATIELITVGSWSRLDVLDPVLLALEHLPRPLGIFAYNDDLAMAAYIGIERAGLSIPHDVSIVGFDDEPRAAFAIPGLTTVYQPVSAMAANAVDLLFDAGTMPAADSEHHPDGALDVSFPARLIVRGSTRL